MKPRVVAAVAAVLLAVLGVAALVVYASGAQQRAYDGAALRAVYQVTGEIGENADADAVKGNVALVELPNDAIAEGAISDLSEIADLRTSAVLVPGEQLVKARFVEEGSSFGGLAVPDGKQLIALTLDAAAAGGPYVTSGSTVGVVTTISEDGEPVTKMVASGLSVVDAKRSEGAIEVAPVLVTLAVSQNQAETIADAVVNGSVRLISQTESK